MTWAKGLAELRRVEQHHEGSAGSASSAGGGDVQALDNDEPVTADDPTTAMTCAYRWDAMRLSAIWDTAFVSPQVGEKTDRRTNVTTSMLRSVVAASMPTDRAATRQSGDGRPPHRSAGSPGAPAKNTPDSDRAEGALRWNTTSIC